MTCIDDTTIGTAFGGKTTLDDVASLCNPSAALAGQGLSRIRANDVCGSLAPSTIKGADQDLTRCFGLRELGILPLVESYDWTAGLATPAPIRRIVTASPKGFLNALLRVVLDEGVPLVGTNWAELTTESYIPEVVDAHDLPLMVIYSGQPISVRSADTLLRPQLSTLNSINEQLDKLWLSIERINRVADELAEAPISDSAMQACLRLAKDLLSSVRGEPDFEIVVSPEDEGGASLVAHSFTTGRRFSILTSPGGQLGEVIQVDERLGVQSAPLTDPQQVLPGLIRWLRNRP